MAGDARAAGYRQLSDIEHVRERCGMYAGSDKPERSAQWVGHVSSEGLRVEKREIEFVPAMRKLFCEVLDNATDAAGRDDTVRTIKDRKSVV